MAEVKPLVSSFTSPFHSYISAGHQQNFVNSTLQIDPKDKSWRFLPPHVQSGQSRHHHSAGLLNSPPNRCPCFCTDLPPGSSQRDPKTQVWYPLSSQNLPMSSRHTQCKSQSCDEDLQGCPRAAQIYMHPCPPTQADTHIRTRTVTWTHTRGHTQTPCYLCPHLPLPSPSFPLLQPLQPPQCWSGQMRSLSRNALPETIHMAHSLISVRSLPKSRLLREGFSGHLTKM